MNLIINIDKKDYEYMKDGYVPHSFNMFYAIKTGIPIPDDATNGSVIRTMFPNAEIMITDEKVFLRDGTIVMIYPLIWWNAPYQEDDNIVPKCL